MKRVMFLAALCAAAVSGTRSGSAQNEIPAGRGAWRSGPPGPPPGIALLKGVGGDFRKLARSIETKRRRVESLRAELGQAGSGEEKEEIRAKLREAVRDLIRERRRLARMKRDVAKRLLRNALDRYVESERELARLQAAPALRRRLRALGPPPKEAGTETP